MIIVDFSGISISTVFSQPKSNIDEHLLRHMILNSLRMYNLKYRDEYGKLIVACDAGSWRKGTFPEYKAARKKNRESSDMDWKSIFESINKVRDEIDEFMPYPVVQVSNAEADDVIATLVETTQEFGNHEKVMIVSADKDFIQLQKYDNVQQFSPLTKKVVKDTNPRKYLFEHVVRGDSGDGVPNVLSPDNVFVSESRQTPLRAKKIEEWYNASSKGDMQEILDEETYRNYVRNKSMIDLSQIPQEIASNIVDEYNKKQVKPNGKVLNYLITRRCSQLVACAEEFFIK
jgi:5'-3' exonuclease